MSRVIGGSSSFEAYSRMLDEMKQKHTDQKVSDARNDKISRTYVQEQDTSSNGDAEGAAVKTGPGIDTYA